MKRVLKGMYVRTEAEQDSDTVQGDVLEVIRGKDRGWKDTEYYKVKISKPKRKEGQVITIRLDQIRRAEWPKK